MECLKCNGEVKEIKLLGKVICFDCGFFIKDFEKVESKEIEDKIKRSIGLILMEINGVSTKLKLPLKVIKNACKVYRENVRDGLFCGPRWEEVISGCIYYACKKNNVKKDLIEISEVVKGDVKDSKDIFDRLKEKEDLEYKKLIKGTEEKLREIEKHKEKYFIEILDTKFIIFPGVFSPKYFEDPEFFVENIKVKENEEFAEIGCGSGIVSVNVAMKGCKVYCTDINENAVENTKENAKMNNVELNVFLGDMFDPLPRMRFDTIFWNFPFGYVERENLTVLEKSVFDPYYKILKDLFLKLEII